MIWMYVGTYTRADSRGIYAIGYDETADAFGPPTLAAETPNPSFLALSDDGRRLYAACDPGTFDGKPSGGAAAFAVDPKTHALTPLGMPQKAGGGNCHVGLTPDGRTLLTADYGSAEVHLMPVASDGSLGPVAATDRHTGHGPVTDRQEAAHAHCATPDPSGRWAVSCDLGSDEIYVYDLSAAPRLVRYGVIKVQPGDGPRHVAFAPDGRTVYVVNELGNSVDAFRWEAHAGTLTHLQHTPTLPADFQAYSKAAEVAVHPTGAFVYASNRGHDSIAVFHVDRDTGRLSVAGHVPVGGKNPRHFGLDPSGRILVAANEESDNLVAFRIDEQTGMPTPTGGVARVSRPVCVVLPRG